MILTQKNRRRGRPLQNNDRSTNETTASDFSVSSQGSTTTVLPSVVTKEQFHLCEGRPLWRLR